MPFYMHQWAYKDTQVRAMVTELQDRAEIVRVATEAFGGTLHHFFFAFGEYDGVSISEFPDKETAMACVLAAFGEGRLHAIRTTALLTADEGGRAIRKARDIIVSSPGSRD